MSDDWPFDVAKKMAVFTTSQVLNGKPIIHVFHDLEDESWHFHSESSPRSEDAKVVALSEIAKIDPSILELAKLPRGWKADRESKNRPWVRSNLLNDSTDNPEGKVFRFKCVTCGRTHEGSPSLSFENPFHYSCLTDEEKAKSRLDIDFCVIEDRDYFIRVILEVPILGAKEPFAWGVWVSQSRANFDAYAAHFKKEDDREPTPGWFSNKLP